MISVVERASTMMILPGLVLTETQFTERTLQMMILSVMHGRNRMDSRQINEHFLRISRESSKDLARTGRRWIDEILC